MRVIVRKVSYVIRILDQEIDPHYLATVLWSSLILAQTKHMMTGNTHPRLNNDDVINLIIPVPDRQTQQAIADELNHRRLRAQADADWAAAKARFEATLLGE